MKKILLVFSIILSACAPAAALPAPALTQPVSVKADTAIVTRGIVERMEQYRSYVRIRSEGLFFVDTGLRFDEYLVMAGERVVEGQLLARLDTEKIEEQIEEQEERLERIRREQRYEADMLVLDIDIARAEYVNMIRTIDFDEVSMEAAEQKKVAIERAELNLAQTLERHALNLRHSESYLIELKERLPEAEIRAPFDGIITLRLPKEAGDYVEPFENMVYISDEQTLLLEYAGDESLSPSRAQTIKAFYGDEVFEMERIPLTRQEAAFYSSRHMVSPLRMTTIDPNVSLPSPGTFLTLRVYAGVSEDTLRIPANALFSESDMGHYVHRMENGNKIPVQVEVGIVTDVWVEIEHGLAEGDEVYVKP